MDKMGTHQNVWHLKKQWFIVRYDDEIIGTKYNNSITVMVQMLGHKSYQG